MKETLIKLAVVQALYAPSSLACSGDGAAKEIGFNNAFSWFTVGLICGISVLVVLSRIKRQASGYVTAGFIVVLACVLAVHPIRVIGVYSGDCGIVTYYSSLFVATLYILLAIYESAKLLKSRDRNE